MLLLAWLSSAQLMRPESLLMEAYHRRRGEDRVTEVLATVLHGTPTYTAQLAERVGLPRPAEYEVETQVAAPGCIADLQIRALTVDGDTGWLLWSEHKVHAPFSPNQLSRLAEAVQLQAGPLPSRLIAVTLYQPPAKIVTEAKAHDVQLLLWRDMVALAHAAGVELGGAAWRSRESSGAEELARRLLLEWQAFCAHELEETVVEPLTSRHIEILPQIESAQNSLDHLVQHGFRGACQAIGAGAPKDKGDYWSAAAPAGTWLAEHGLNLYASYDADDSWAVAPRGEPIFVAGAWAEGAEAESLRNDERLQGVADRGFSFSDEGTGRAAYLDIALTLPMSDVAAIPTLEDQERVVAQLCERACSELLAAATV